MVQSPAVRFDHRAFSASTLASSGSGELPSSDFAFAHPNLRNQCIEWGKRSESHHSTLVGWDSVCGLFPPYGLASGALDRLGLARRLVAVKNTRTFGKRDLIHNDAMPQMEVDAQIYEVRDDGEMLVCEPAAVLPLAQRYFLF